LDLIQEKILQLSDFIFKNPLSYKTAGLEALLSQIDHYEKTQPPRKVKAIDNDIIRFGYFSLGNSYYQKNEYDHAKGYYECSMMYSKYNRNCFIYSNDYLQSDLKLNSNEIEKYSFSQFICYNLCCALAKLKKYDEAVGWLKVSIRISSAINQIAIKDIDLEGLREYMNTLGLSVL
jgi:tetratricopeptide (TPR) repeat protein